MLLYEYVDPRVSGPEQPTPESNITPVPEVDKESPLQSADSTDLSSDCGLLEAFVALFTKLLDTFDFSFLSRPWVWGKGVAPLQATDTVSDDNLLGAFRALFEQALDRTSFGTADRNRSEAPLQAADTTSDDNLLGAFRALFGQALDRTSSDTSATVRNMADSAAPLQTSGFTTDDSLTGALAALFDRIGQRPWFNFNYSAGPSAYPVTLTYPKLDYSDIRPIIYHKIPKPTFPLCESCLQG